ncbi:MAG TPA: hypothetical protein VFS67_16865 [Polyangiaceae bacterium]|nr:hypothetical protein [Polyangiaceae bacterium]
MVSEHLPVAFRRSSLLRGLGGAVVLSSGLACSVLPDSTSDAPAAPLTCSSDSQCTKGHCLLPFGVCSQDQGELTHLLFEITPPASDPVYGGARFLTILDLDAADPQGAPERGIEPGWIELNVRPRVPVSGSVSAPPDQSDCSSGAGSTLPVSLTFTPRERLFGLSVPSYDLTAKLDERTLEYTFRGSLPPGNYDVYMRPDAQVLGENCLAIPQIFHKRQIGSTFKPFEQAPLASLQLTFAGQDDHDGWVVDMVHPVTGEVISNRVRLSAAHRDPVSHALRAKLYYSRDVDDFIMSGTELVRLTPPPDPNVVAGTVFLQRSGLEFAAAGEGTIGDIFQFGNAVNFQAWVWGESQLDVPVPATVDFAARDLDDMADGVLTLFNRSATVDEKGQVRVQLLPGEYRVRVTPPGVVVKEALGQLSSLETTVTVWPNENGSARVQGGNVILVPPASALSGRVIAESDRQPVPNVEVRASASEQELCPVATAGDLPLPCTMRDAVLTKVRAVDPFVPRTRTGLSHADGEFVVDGLDCRQCTAGGGVRLDLSLRPPPETRLPWLIERAYYLPGDKRIAQPLVLKRPVAHAVRLTYGDPAPLASSEPQSTGVAPALAGALVRVYALLSDQQKLLTDPADIEPCITVGASQSGHCVQSVLQVAELRSGDDGEFLLLLPPSLSP